jgi:formylglycine-generating enzyme required for sulfatase activity
MEKRKPDCYDFITNVIEWTKDPGNSSLVDYHISCRKVMTDAKFRKTIREFLAQRLLQGEGLKESEMPKNFMTKSVNLYISDVL